MNTQPGDDIITNSDESRRLPDENPEPLEGIKKEESTLIEADKPKTEKKEDKTDPKAKEKKEMK